MDDAQKFMIEKLVADFGLFLDLAQLASLWKRKPAAMRMVLKRSSPWALRMRQAQVKVGRKIYWRAHDVAMISCARDA